MPGFVIHLAVAKKQIKLDNIENEEDFIKGVIAPDLLKKQSIESHYGVSFGKPEWEKYFKNYDLKTDYNKGYFLHLITDYIFYSKYVTDWKPEIYDDYDVLNDILIEKYDLKIPKEIESYVGSQNKPLTILNLDDIITFIETVGNMSIENLYKKYIGEKV